MRCRPHLDDDVRELARIDQPPQGIDRKLELLAARHRLLADLAGRDLQVFRAEMALMMSVGARPERGHLVRVEPGPHAVVALAQVVDIGDAGQSSQFVFDLNRGVIAQEDIALLAGRLGRIDFGDQVDDHQRAGRHLLDRDAFALHRSGMTGSASEARFCTSTWAMSESMPILNVTLRGSAVVRALARHVKHVLDAGNLLLNWRGHGVPARYWHLRRDRWR